MREYTGVGILRITHLANVGTLAPHVRPGLFEFELFVFISDKERSNLLIIWNSLSPKRKSEGERRVDTYLTFYHLHVIGDEANIILNLK